MQLFLNIKVILIKNLVKISKNIIFNVICEFTRNSINAKSKTFYYSKQKMYKTL